MVPAPLWGATPLLGHEEAESRDEATAVPNAQTEVLAPQQEVTFDGHD